jgi:multimeric flavodoxin WrbA
MEKIKIVAVYGSPRRQGNTATLLQKAVEGARYGGAEVEEIGFNPSGLKNTG